MQQRTIKIVAKQKFETSEDEPNAILSNLQINNENEKFETSSEDEQQVYLGLDNFLSPANQIIQKSQAISISVQSLFTQPFRITPKFNLNYTPSKETPMNPQSIQQIQFSEDRVLQTLMDHYEENKEKLVYQRFQDIDLGKHPPEGNKLYFATMVANLQKKTPKILFRSEQVIGNFSKGNQKIIFESNFESGNLFCAYQVNDQEYDLILQNDFNSRGNTQWFYFSVKGVEQGQCLKFNIINHLKSGSLFNDGMKPAVYSECENKLSGQEWIRAGTNIMYYKNQYTKEYPLGSTRQYYTLTYNYTFEHDDDVVYFAHSYPYTFSDLQGYLNEVLGDKNRNQHISRKVLCKSILGNNCDVITITSSSLERRQYRKGIVFMARQHPGEPQGSYVMQGIINYLTSPEAEFLREYCIFKILPMMNADGVILGNYRCGLEGNDLNRHWKKPNKKLHPTVYFAKKYIKGFSKERKILMVCDLHGHSRKQGSFFYGCSYSSSQKSVERTFALLMSKISKNMQYQECTFRVERLKEKTARIQLFRELKINWSYTYECSFFGQNRTHYTIQDYLQCGKDLCLTLRELLHDQVKKKDEGQQKFKLKHIISIQQRLMLEMETLTPTDDIDDGSDSSPSENELSDSELANIYQPTTLSKRQKQTQLKKQLFQAQKIQFQPQSSPQRSILLQQPQQQPQQLSQMIKSSPKRPTLRIYVTQRSNVSSPKQIIRKTSTNFSSSLQKISVSSITLSPLKELIQTQEKLQMVDKSVQTEEWLYRYILFKQNQSRDWIRQKGTNKRSVPLEDQNQTPLIQRSPQLSNTMSVKGNFVSKQCPTPQSQAKKKEFNHIKANFSQGFAQLKFRPDLRHNSQFQSIIRCQNSSLSQSKLPLLYSGQK